MKIKKIASATTVTIRLFFAFYTIFTLNACSLTKSEPIQHTSAVEKDFARSPFLNKKVQINTETLKKQDAQFAVANKDSFLQSIFGRSESDTVIPAGTELAVIIDSNCVDKKNESLSSEVANLSQDKKILKYHAYAHRVQEGTDIKKLTIAANADPCVVGISENGEVKAASTGIITSPSALPPTVQLRVKAAGEVGAQFAVNDPLAAVIGDNRHMTQTRAYDSWDILINGKGAGNAQTILAVVDTGVYYTHPDLAANIYTDAAGNHGFDFINNDNDPIDDHYHGTHVAGLAAAVGNNGIGFVGIAFRDTKIMAVKVLGATGSGTFTAAANGVRYAVDNGATVINLSLGGLGAVPIMRDAIEYAVVRNAVVMLAAGNDNISVDINAYSPAMYGADFEGAMTVGSIDASTQLRSSFSNFGTTRVEIAAPGSNFPTQLCNAIRPGSNPSDPAAMYGCLAGTSMATPIVAGAAALARSFLNSRNIPHGPAEIENYIFNSADANGNLFGFFKDSRQLNLVNLANALNVVIARPPTFTIVPTGVSVNMGEAFTLRSFATNGATYQWFRNNVFTGITTRNYSVAAATAADNGLYRVVATNSVASVAVEASVVVRAPPVIQTQPLNLTVNENQTANFAVAATGNPAPTYQWRFNGANINGATAPTLVLAAVNRNQAGAYSVLVSNEVGSVPSVNAGLIVQYVPTLTAQSASVVVPTGGAATLTVATDAIPPATYQWFRMLPSGVMETIPGAVNAAIILSPITWSQRGIYQVRATNVVGAVTSTPVRVDIPSITRSPAGVVDPAMPTVGLDRTGGFKEIENSEGL